MNKKRVLISRSIDQEEGVEYDSFEEAVEVLKEYIQEIEE